MSFLGFGKKKESKRVSDKKNCQKVGDEPKNEDKGSFLGFVLLSESEWDREQFQNDFYEDWGIEVSNDEEEVRIDENEDIIILERDNMLITISLMPAAIPGGEVEHYAVGNYMWPEAVDVAKAHKAHILVAVVGNEADLYERGKMLVKAISSCCKQRYASGVYTNGAVFLPKFYRDFSMMMKEGELPVMNWVWFGLHRNGKKEGAYTYGMKLFGKEEMEVYAEDTDLVKIRDFLINIVVYVLDSDVTLNDGETIGFSADQKLPITRSKGIALDGVTLKIGISKNSVC